MLLSGSNVFPKRKRAVRKTLSAERTLTVEKCCVDALAFAMITCNITEFNTNVPSFL